MGVDLNVYYGPYVECRTRLVDEEEKIHCCPNEQCIAFKSRKFHDKFCPHCGNEIKDVVFTKKATSIDDYAVRMELKERMTTPMGDSFARWQEENQTHIWIGNIHGPGNGNMFDPKTDFFGVVKMPPSEIDAEIDAFIKQYGPEIAKLKEIYGEDNVRVRWGIFNQIS